MSSEKQIKLHDIHNKLTLLARPIEICSLSNVSNISTMYLTSMHKKQKHNHKIIQCTKLNTTHHCIALK